MIVRDLGCCQATCKEDCKRPPCPCNLSTYSPDELKALRAHSVRVKSNERTR